MSLIESGQVVAFKKYIYLENMILLLTAISLPFFSDYWRSWQEYYSKTITFFNNLFKMGDGFAINSWYVC